MTKKIFKIDGHQIRENGDIFIIAEAGVNHNQNLNLALKLIDVAAKCGADAVKFQTFKAEQVVTSEGEMAYYQKKNTGKIQSQRNMLKNLELPENFYPKLIKRCIQKNILFMSTPHGGNTSVDLLEKFNICAYKIGSGDLTNYLLLQRVAKTGKPIILSSGMATLKEVKNAIGFIRSCGNNKIAVLHCTTNYPCPPEEVNLKAMLTMMKKLDIPVGYSDHAQGNQVGLMAATLGAAIYECHFTLDKKLPGPDHIASSEPQELKQKIQEIRNVNLILGNGVKKPNKSELDSMIPLVRRSIVASSNLASGHILTLPDLEAKRPGTGISPTKYKHFIGKKLKKPLKIDQQLSFSDI